jgi:hypothetical protein
MLGDCIVDDADIKTRLKPHLGLSWNKQIHDSTDNVELGAR